MLAYHGDMPLFENVDEQRVIDAYAEQGRTLDDLPYTQEFEAIYHVLTEGESQPAVSKAELFHRLHNIRKAGRLPRLGRAKGSITKIDADQERVLIELVEAAVGSLSKRDQLPYTPAFTELITDFNERASLNLEPHQVWRIIAKLAK